MRELVDEQIVGPRAVDRRRREDVVEAAAAVGGAVHQDGDELVRRPGGDVAEGPVLVGEDVALQAEDVVGRADRCTAMDVGRRPRHPGLDRWRAQPPDVEVAPALAERLAREEGVGHPGWRRRGTWCRTGRRCSRRRAAAGRPPARGRRGVRPRSGPAAAGRRGSRRGCPDRRASARPRRTPATGRGERPRRPPAPPAPGSGTTRGTCDRRWRPRPWSPTPRRSGRTRARTSPVRPARALHSGSCRSRWCRGCREDSLATAAARPPLRRRRTLRCRARRYGRRRGATSPRRTPGRVRPGSRRERR